MIPGCISQLHTWNCTDWNTWTLSCQILFNQKFAFTWYSLFLSVSYLNSFPFCMFCIFKVVFSCCLYSLRQGSSNSEERSSWLNFLNLRTIPKRLENNELNIRVCHSAPQKEHIKDLNISTEQQETSLICSSTAQTIFQ